MRRGFVLLLKGGGGAEAGFCPVLLLLLLLAGCVIFCFVFLLLCSFIHISSAVALFCLNARPTTTLSFFQI
jgi:hypothetical protein